VDRKTVFANTTCLKNVSKQHFEVCVSTYSHQSAFWHVMFRFFVKQTSYSSTFTSQSKEMFCEFALILMIYWVAERLPIPSSVSKIVHRIDKIGAKIESAKALCRFFKIFVQNLASPGVACVC